ncbi:hypothetical protein HHI36_010573 [Cryptolaemus montrouzieri]|uniref:Proton channel OtopLc-like n=1 Tax=Cryptolaemus montrouzieri TaxID=559131 RepID=A0ABD2MJV6_9CUCU
MNRLPNRLHSSSPILNENSIPREHSTLVRKRVQPVKYENEFLVNFIASLYCKALVVLGVALPITDAITLKSSIFFFKLFYVYLYMGSITFLCYMCLIQMKEKSLRQSLYEMRKTNLTPLLLESSRSERINQPVKYGSFYLRMGVTGFGMGSVIYAGFQFVQYFEHSAECAYLLKALKPLLRMIFVLMQILFILSTNNFVHVRKCKMISRFGLMHMIATNLCEWFLVVVKETQHDIHKSAKNLLANNKTFFHELYQSNTSMMVQTNRFYEEKEQCLSTNIVGPVLYNTEPYLAPCTIEYSVLCAVILGLIWKKNLTHSNEDADLELSIRTYEKSKGNIDVERETKSRFSVDCSKAHKGLFSGILVLILTIMTLILYAELQTHDEYIHLGFTMISIWEFLLFWMGTLAAISCIISLKDVGYYRKSRDLELEHLLLLLSQSGIFIYNLFQIMGAIHMAFRKGLKFCRILRIVTPLSCLIQSCAQTTLVLMAWRRRCIAESHIKRKPGKQLVTFLLLSNFANWIMCRFNHNISTSHPIQMDFYGLLAWNIITHVSIPLLLTYRFQSTVCFYEIWTHVYKGTRIEVTCGDSRKK